MATSAYQRGINGRLSMFEKSLERRRVNKEHNSNFRAGHVPVHEDHLHKTGLRGRKRYFAYCFLALLYISAIGNLAITALVMWTLRIDQNGLHSLQLLRGGLVRFLDETEVDNIITRYGEIGGFMGQDLQITGQDSSVRVAANGKSLETISIVTCTAQVNLIHAGINVTLTFEVSPGETIMRGQKGLEVTSPRSGATIFHTDANMEVIVPPKMKTLQSARITTPKIVSDAENDLTISSDGAVEILGSETLDLTAKVLDVEAKEIRMTSVSALVLDGNAGTFLNTTLLPKASISIANRPTATVFKLCVCKTTGKIFQVPVQSSVQHPCANLDSNFNMCL